MEAVDEIVASTSLPRTQQVAVSASIRWDEKVPQNGIYFFPV